MKEDIERLIASGELKVIEETCPLCGQTRETYEFQNVRLMPAPRRPEHEYEANNGPDWRKGEQSDNLRTRKE